MKELSTLTGDELWKEARRNNKEAFELLYHQAAILLINQAFKILKDEARAKDIVQEIFVSIYVKRHELPEEININGYLCNAVKYKVSNALRDDMRKGKHFSNLVKNTQLVEQDATSAYERKELQQRIGNSIDRLPEKCRRAFNLNYHDNLSYKSVALRMGISVKTVEKHISKALSVLRNDLKSRSGI